MVETPNKERFYQNLFSVEFADYKILNILWFLGGEKLFFL